MDSIPVIWCFGNRGDRCHGLVEDALDGEFGPTGLTFTHHIDLNSAGTSVTHGILVVSGGVQLDYVAEIEAAVSRLSWALILITADEETKFDWRRLQGPRRKIWVQMPCGEKTKGCDRVFPIGYPTGTRQLLRSIGLPSPEAPRRYPWCFIGQMQHQQRRECIEALGWRKDGGRLSRTGGFAQGYKREDYLREMMQAYLAPGPAGMYTVDCFRFWEALECGCLPVCDKRHFSQPPSYNYWIDLLGGSPPFPTVSNWREFAAIADRYMRDPEALRQDTRAALAWWGYYKAGLVGWLVQDLKELSCNPAGTV